MSTSAAREVSKASDGLRMTALWTVADRMRHLARRSLALVQINKATDPPAHLAAMRAVSQHAHGTHRVVVTFDHGSSPQARTDTSSLRACNRGTDNPACHRTDHWMRT